MKVQQVFCDFCGREDSAVARAIELHLTTGKSPDPSGHGYQDDIKRVDICKKCLTKVVKEAVDDGRLTYNEQDKTWHVPGR